MNLGILTSSRADFGIYLPLLKALKNESYFSFEIICFGTHLSELHGYTKNEIISNNFKIDHEINTVISSDSPNGISSSIGITISKFADFWKKNNKKYDIVICLGDRYEMFAAVISGIPFQIKFAHIHGGETTLGAIDNIFRHSISLASSIHFVTNQYFKDRLNDLLENKNNVFVTGALGLDNIKNLKLFSKNEFLKKYSINLLNKTILVTYHPETVLFLKNKQYLNQLINIINDNSEYQYIITMSNNDTTGNMIRKELFNQLQNHKNVWLVESFGSKGYLTAMKYCCFLLGNTSSGIIEAASFGKYVINLGDRQKGRKHGSNVIHSNFQYEQIQKSIDLIKTLPEYSDGNIYGDGNSTKRILKILKNIND